MRRAGAIFDVMIRQTTRFPVLLGLALATALFAPAAASAQAVVRSVLFYSPYCPHCHKVINEDLPPLAAKYGSRFQVAGVDVTTPQGSALYAATMEYFGSDETGVPLMVVGDVMLIGDQEIPQRLPGLIEDGLAKGGIPFPAVPAIQAALAQTQQAEEEAAQGEPTPSADSGAAADAAGQPEAEGAVAAAPEPSADAPVAEPSSGAPAAEGGQSGISSSLGADATNPSMMDRLRRDPAGNGIAVATLLGLILAMLMAVVSARTPGTGPSKVPAWVVPLLSVIGVGVAAYLSFVEVSGSSAVCGPVGDCNAVQQSSYAHLFGIIPVGVLGMVGYVGIIGAWFFSKVKGGRGPFRALWWMTLLGTAFSAYLTFLEPFVIGATCMWCITSAVVMALLLLTATSLVRAPSA